MAVIMLVGAMHFDAGFNDDLRLADMGAFIPFVTDKGLRDLGIEGQSKRDPLEARQERIEEVRQCDGIALTFFHSPP